MYGWLSPKFSLDIFIGLAVGLILSGIIILISRLIKKPEKFDERQMIARGKAYKISLVTLVVYLMVCLLCRNLNFYWAHFDIQIYFGLLIAFAVFEFIAIVSGANMGFNRSIKWNKISIIGLYLGSCFLFLESLFLYFVTGVPFVYRELLTFLALLVAVAIVFAVLATAITVRLSKDKKETL